MRSARLGPVVGAWRVIKLASRAPGEVWAAAAAPNHSLYLITGARYSYLLTRSEPRPPFVGDQNRPSDAEKVSAYDSFGEPCSCASVEPATNVFKYARTPHRLSSGLTSRGS